MTTASGHSCQNDLQAALDDMEANMVESRAADDKLIAAGRDHEVIVNKLVAAVNAYATAYTNLEIAIVQLRSIVKFAEDQSTDASVTTTHDTIIDFFSAAVNAYSIVAECTNTIKETTDSCNAKNKALQVKLEVVTAKSSDFNYMLGALVDKLHGTKRILPEHEITAMHAKAMAVTALTNAGKLQAVIAKQYVMTEMVKLAQKKYDSTTAMLDAAKDDITAIFNRTNKVLDKNMAHMKDLLRAAQGQ